MEKENDGIKLMLKPKSDEVLAKFPIKENLTIIHRRDGEIIDKRQYENLVTSAGKAGVASRIAGAGAEAAFTYVAIGIGTTAAAIGDTTLVSEITTGGGARAVDASLTRETTTVTNDTAVIDYTFSFTSTFAVTESGVLNAAAAGTLLSRRVFSAINVVSGDSLQMIWKYQVS